MTLLQLQNLVNKKIDFVSEYNLQISITIVIHLIAFVCIE